MARSAIRVGGVAAGSIAGAAEFQKFLDGYPHQVVADTRRALEQGADQLVDDIKAAAPVSTLEGRPGELRDSVHREDGRHDLSIVVVEDPKDAAGHGYGPHVEYGHTNRDGSHTPGEPHFWPAVRTAKRKVVAAIRSSMRRAAKGAG